MPYNVCFVTLLLLLFFSNEQANVINQSVLLNTIMTGGENMTALETFKEKTIDNRITLKVALFPYIPDSGGDGYKGLRAYIKNDFERSFPEYNLEIRDLTLNNDGFYNLSILTDWLTNSVNGFDVVEVDTVLLGDLVNAALIVPQWISPIDTATWHSSAVTAIEFNQAYYAYPHLSCAFFLITYNHRVSQAQTMEELITSLGGIPSGIQRIVGNLDSSWDLPALWIDSFRDTYPSESHTEAEALHDYKYFKFETLRKLARLCDILGQPNPCLNGTFEDPDRMADLFIKGQATSLFGYSERLFRIIKYGFPGAVNYVKVSPLPLGTFRNEPVFFTDAFVLRRNMSSALRRAADIFVRYMGFPHIQAAVVGSGDVPKSNRIPRYLLPISKLAYDDPLLKSDPIYQQVFRRLNGTSYPTAGFLNGRKALQSAILKYIQ